jgi:hypothetical protein
MLPDDYSLPPLEDKVMMLQKPLAINLVIREA